MMMMMMMMVVVSPFISQVTHVQSARDLLRCISQAHSFDFVLLDWNLAVKDSFSVMFHLRRRPTSPNYLPIVAYGPKVDPDKAKEVSRILRQVWRERASHRIA